MSTLDYILIAVFALFFLVGLIRGLKHRASRFEGDLFAFLFAFFFAGFLEGILYLNIPNFATFYTDFQKTMTVDSFTFIGPWIIAVVLILVLFLPLFFLFRFFYRHLANKRLYTAFLSLFTYLLSAYLIGLLLVSFVSQTTGTLNTWYQQSLLANSLYPSTSILNYFALLGGYLHG